MANPEHLAKLQRGWEGWNRWRGEHFEIHPDLTNANLRGTNLDRMNLSGADLSRADLGDDCTLSARVVTSLLRADLRRAHLVQTNLVGADLREADLRGAHLVQTNFVGANLREAALCEAFLEFANLTGAELSDSDFAESQILWTIFADNDLGSVKGLADVIHVGPSIIGIDTIYRSKGKIPDVFLRGCGVPDEFIIYAKSLVTNPIQFYSCFISYSTKDQDFADRLYADLQNKSVRCWFAPHDIQSGKKIHEQIDEAIRLHDKLLLILSPHSMESEWVKTEIAKARKRELRDQRRVLFPIRLAPFETLRDWECFDADTGKDSAREIREYFIPDFSNWKNHDSYQEAFQRLLTDLKASDAKPK
jgi:hypothetical protein